MPDLLNTRWFAVLFIATNLLTVCVLSSVANGQEQRKKYYDSEFGNYMYRSRAELSQLKVFQRSATGSDFLDAEAVQSLLPYDLYGSTDTSLRLALNTNKYRYYITHVRRDGIEDPFPDIEDDVDHREGICLVRILLSGPHQGEGDGSCGSFPTTYSTDATPVPKLGFSTSVVAATYSNRTADLMGIAPPNASFVTSEQGEIGVVQNDVFVLEGVRDSKYAIYRNKKLQKPLDQGELPGLWDIYDNPPSEFPALELHAPTLRTATIFYWQGGIMQGSQAVSNSRMGAKSRNVMAADGEKEIWYQRPNGHIANTQRSDPQHPHKILFTDRHETYAKASCKNRSWHPGWVDSCWYDT